MKRLVRYLCLALVVALIPILPVYASEEATPWSSLFFRNYTVYIYKTGDTSYRACYNVTGKDTMQEIGATSLSIQESDDGVNWTTVRTYTTEFYPQMICEGTVYHSWYFGQGATEGKCYRIKVVLYAKNSMGSAERTVYSDPVWF